MASKGFRGEDYLPSPWNGGAYQGKRYTIPLDVPQHIFFLNPKLLKAAGFANQDGAPRFLGARTNCSKWPRKLTSGMSLALPWEWCQYRPIHLGLHNLLWQNGANIFTPDLKKCALTERRPSRLLNSGGDICEKQDRHTAERQSTRTRSSQEDRDVDCRFLERRRPARGEGRLCGGPVPRLFKQPTVFTIPHQFSFPKPKTAMPPSGKRPGPISAGLRITWPSGPFAPARSPRTASPTRIRVSPGPCLKTLLAQGLIGKTVSPRRSGCGREPHPSGDRRYVHRSEAAKEAMADLARQINALPD